MHCRAGPGAAHAAVSGCDTLRYCDACDRLYEAETPREWCPECREPVRG